MLSQTEEWTKTLQQLFKILQPLIEAQEIQPIALSAASAAEDAEELNNSTTISHDISICCICFINKPVYAFIPCGHLALCETCKESSTNDFRKCPVCQLETTSLMKIFT
mmetsp:Transcript_26542/g.61108  ORF Transcript_26542/g.61108 Transcript_26542/m.61108 type:complete len:109 (-) Transcript_26542:43-369(-)